jgi:hypothetical protein
MKKIIGVGMVLLMLGVIPLVFAFNPDNPDEPTGRPKKPIGGGAGIPDEVIVEQHTPIVRSGDGRKKNVLGREKPLLLKVTSHYAKQFYIGRQRFRTLWNGGEELKFEKFEGREGYVQVSKEEMEIDYELISVESRRGSQDRLLVKLSITEEK